MYVIFNCKITKIKKCNFDIKLNNTRFLFVKIFIYFIAKEQLTW